MAAGDEPDVRDGKDLRRLALGLKVPIITTVAGARATALALRGLVTKPLDMVPLQVPPPPLFRPTPSCKTACSNLPPLSKGPHGVVVAQLHDSVFLGELHVYGVTFLSSRPQDYFPEYNAAVKRLAQEAEVAAEPAPIK